MTASQKPRRTAGLSLSVGSASFGVRCFLALVFGVVGIVCLVAAAGMGGTGPAAATAVAVLAIVPLGCIGVIAAAYTIAPFSRFGMWLDVFAGNLTWARVAAVFAVFWILGAVMILVRHGTMAAGVRALPAIERLPGDYERGARSALRRPVIVAPVDASCAAPASHAKVACHATDRAHRR